MKPLILRGDRLYYYNGPLMGDVYKEVDGYYVFVPKGSGFWESHQLRQVADYLDEINKPWHDEVCQYFESLRENDNA